MRINTEYYKIFSIFIFICFFSVSAYSQDFPIGNSKKNVFTINLTRLVLLEGRLGYEHYLCDRHLIRVNVGIKIPLSDSSFKSFSVGLGYLPNHYRVLEGVYVGLSYNYFLSERKGIYASADIYFNYSYYNNKYYQFSVGTDMDSYVCFQSMDLRKSGIKLLIGKKALLYNDNSVGIILDLFTGFGAQYRQEEVTIFKKKQGSSNIIDQYNFVVYNPPKKEISNTWYPTLHAGISLGMIF